MHTNYTCIHSIISPTAGHCQPRPRAYVPLPNPAVLLPVRCCCLLACFLACLLLPLMLPTGGALLQRPGRLPFRHVSVIEGRNLAHPPGLPRRVQPAAQNAQARRGGTEHSVLCSFAMSAEMSGLPSSTPCPLGAGPRESARRASSSSSSSLPPFPACLLRTCITYNYGLAYHSRTRTRLSRSLAATIRGRPRFREGLIKVLSESSSTAHLLRSRRGMRFVTETEGHDTRGES